MASHNPLVSVIIPNYNHARYLTERIESVLNQSFKDLEIILLDDCSTDNSVDIINSYKSHPLISTIVYNQTNSGSAFKQWQKGLQHTKGKWVWIAESDDVAKPNFLQCMMEAISNVEESIGLAYCDSYIMDEMGSINSDTFKVIKNRKYNTDRWALHYKNNGQAEIRDWFLPDGTINNTSAVLFNRETLIHANPFDLELTYIGDKYAFMKVMALSDILYIPDTLNLYRNPINTKYLNKLNEIFHEQFLIFNWAYKTKILSSTQFQRFFLSATRVSLFRNWNKGKRKIFLQVFITNWKLALVCFGYNLFYPIIARLSR